MLRVERKKVEYFITIKILVYKVLWGPLRGFLWDIEINMILQGSNVLTPEGVATVWNISQVRFED